MNKDMAWIRNRNRRNEGDQMKMHIIKAGSLTTVQDVGRYGYMEYGVGESGAMDRYSFERANWLVGNDNNEAGLEITLMGPEIEFDDNTIIAFMGADMDVEIDGIPIKRGRAYEILKGQKLSFGYAKSGIRTYLAISGGINVPVVMGSRSTNLMCNIGGMYGRKLLNDDELEIGNGKIRDKSELMRRRADVNTYSGDICVRVIKGPQDDYFTEGGIKTFLNNDYKVTPESNRMGIRLSGEKIESKNGMDIVSDGITFGSIQVTSAGLPIILMADHQTTGGYAKIATVVKEDLPLLAQARPGDSVRFKCVTLKDLKKGRFIKYLGNNEKTYMRK